MTGPERVRVIADLGNWIAGTISIARRELLALFVTPLAYLVGALFLLIQGWNFSLLLTFLNDPLAASGPVMQFYFGEFYDKVFFQGVVPVPIKELARLRLSTIHGCAL